MKALVVGATGYLGGAVSRALASRGADVHAVARSPEARTRIEAAGFTPVDADIRDPATLAKACVSVDPDAVLFIASAGGGAGDTAAFNADRDAVLAVSEALRGKGRTLLFTSGSAVFGLFNGGEAADPAFAEDTETPLPRAIFARDVEGEEAQFADDLQAAIAHRVVAEQAALRAEGVRGMVIRPANIYGYGGSVDAPAYIRLCATQGFAPYWGAGQSLQAYVHRDDVVALYLAALEQGRAGVFHAAAEEVRQRDLAEAIGRMLGLEARSVTLADMARFGGVRGVRLSLNKRLSTERTRATLGWAPRHCGLLLREIEFGAYRAPGGS